jgi:hypothetical protein
VSAVCVRPASGLCQQAARRQSAGKTIDGDGLHAMPLHVGKQPSTQLHHVSMLVVDRHWFTDNDDRSGMSE